MLSLDDDEVGVALAGLKMCLSTLAADYETDAVVEYFCRNATALISRIEQYQKDQENGDV